MAALLRTIQVAFKAFEHVVAALQPQFGRTLRRTDRAHPAAAEKQQALPGMLRRKRLHLGIEIRMGHHAGIGAPAQRHGSGHHADPVAFRIRAHIDPDLLREHLEQVKTGLPGMAYVRLDPAAAWPAQLQPRLPR